MIKTTKPKIEQKKKVFFFLKHGIKVCGTASKLMSC